MTAVLHPVELLLPGTIQSAKASEEYHVPHRPAPVRGDVRRCISADITCEQRMWSLCVVSSGLIFALLLAYSARQRGVPLEIQREAFRAILIAGVFLLAYLHLHYRRQRRFVENAPVALANVIVEHVTPDEYDFTPSNKPRLALYYTPSPPADSEEEYSMVDGPCPPPIWADLDGFAVPPDRELHPGDLVAILYDPAHPAHIRIAYV
jgi:hypothetical protein